MRDRQTTLTGAMAALLLLLVALLVGRPPGDEPDGEPDFVGLRPPRQRSADPHPADPRRTGGAQRGRRAASVRAPRRRSGPRPGGRRRRRLHPRAAQRLLRRRRARAPGSTNRQWRSSPCGQGRPSLLALGDDSPAGPGTYLQDAAGRIAVSQTPERDSGPSGVRRGAAPYSPSPAPRSPGWRSRAPRSPTRSNAMTRAGVRDRRRPAARPLQQGLGPHRRPRRPRSGLRGGAGAPGAHMEPPGVGWSRAADRDDRRGPRPSGW